MANRNIVNFLPWPLMKILIMVLEILIEHVMEKILSETRMAITEGGVTYKRVSFADSQKQADQFGNAYNKAGHPTKVKKANISGFAVYAKWLNNQKESK